MWLHNRISLQIPYMYRAGTYRYFVRQLNQMRKILYSIYVCRTIGYHNATKRNGSWHDSMERCSDSKLFGICSRIMDWSARMGTSGCQSIEGKSTVYVVTLLERSVFQKFKSFSMWNVELKLRIEHFLQLQCIIYNDPLSRYYIFSVSKHLN